MGYDGCCPIISSSLNNGDVLDLIDQPTPIVPIFKKKKPINFQVV